MTAVLCTLPTSRWLTVVSFAVGKSSLMSVLGNRETAIPKHIDIYHLTREIAPSEKTALECVMEVDQVRLHLEKEAEELALCTSDGRSLTQHSHAHYVSGEQMASTTMP